MPVITSVRSAALILSLALSPLSVAHAQDVVVFAAASLKNALDDAAHAFEQQGGAPVKISYAASSQLAKQIESGAPADIFISADLGWMDYAQKRNLIQPATRRDLLGNKLVMVAPAGSGMKVDMKPGLDLVGMLRGGRLAMADPDSVPAGKYGKAALEKLGIWQSVAPHVAGVELGQQAAKLRSVCLGPARHFPEHFLRSDGAKLPHPRRRDLPARRYPRIAVDHGA